VLDAEAKAMVSRRLGHWLRHKPGRAGLVLDASGWTSIASVVEALGFQDIGATETDIRALVATDPKARFEIEGGRIRARFGHSIELGEQLAPGKPPALLYAGVESRYLARALERGLQPVKRLRVHLSSNRSAAREAAIRRGAEPAILKVLAHEAHASGVRFYPRGLSVWLSDPIPGRFLQIVSSGAERSSAAGGSPGSRSLPRARFIKRPYRAPSA
jgi:putative RNA 2'-phosphotransferase